jgi:hypothetical protein
MARPPDLGEQARGGRPFLAKMRGAGVGLAPEIPALLLCCSETASENQFETHANTRPHGRAPGTTAGQRRGGGGPRRVFSSFLFALFPCSALTSFVFLLSSSFSLFFLFFFPSLFFSSFFPLLLLPSSFFLSSFLFIALGASSSFFFSFVLRCASFPPGGVGGRHSESADISA